MSEPQESSQVQINGAVDLEAIFRNNLVFIYGEKARQIPQAQYNEMRVLFYAGLGSMFVMLVPETVSFDEEQINQRVESVEGQLKKYWSYIQEQSQKKIVTV